MLEGHGSGACSRMGPERGSSVVVWYREGSRYAKMDREPIEGQLIWAHGIGGRGAWVLALRAQYGKIREWENPIHGQGLAVSVRLSNSKEIKK